MSGARPPAPDSPSGVELRTFVSQACGASGFSTGTATFQPGAELACHVHTCSEAITVLSGSAVVIVESRSYRLNRLDSMHVPTGTPHSVRNASHNAVLVAHWAFASATPARTFLHANPVSEDRADGRSLAADPEHLTRFDQAEVYELSGGAFFSDLFAKRFGSQGICGGYGRFTKGSSLPCHTHEYDESITILSGDATCMVQGAPYAMSAVENAFVPKGKPHRFLNAGDADMEMLWVYAGDEPDRTIVDNQYCSGSLTWPG